MKKMTILKTIIIATFAAVMTSIVLSSCSVGRGMTNCDAARFKMSGYR